MTSRAQVDEYDLEYLTLLAELAQPKPPNWDAAAGARRKEVERLAEAAAQRLVDAVTEHDLAAYGEPHPEETPPCAVNPQP